MGHGAGEDFFGEKDIKNLKDINSVVMLVGCSTNKQISSKEQEQILQKKMEMKGISLEYLMANWFNLNYFQFNIFEKVLC